MTVEQKGEDGDGGRSTLQFIVEWAQLRAGGRRRRARTALTAPEVAIVARRVARLLGDRPLGEVTFGDLARLPALLEADGMTTALARSASREIGCALRAAMGCWETPGDAASTAARARR